MRIIGGTFKSRIFTPGKNFKARPTTDFARENLFNILSNRYDFENIKALDLFSGTGSISFELASRGCKEITCVELNRMHFLFIKSVIEKLGLKNIIRSLNEDVFRFLEKNRQKYDLIFADPPYDLNQIKDIPDLIFRNDMLEKDGLLILEHGKSNNFSSYLNFNELRKYGSVHFSFFQPLEAQ